MTVTHRYRFGSSMMILKQKIYDKIQTSCIPTFIVVLTAYWIYRQDGEEKKKNEVVCN